MNDIISKEHLKAVMKFRRLYTLLKENEMLIRIGAYVKGTDSQLDEAMNKKEGMEKFMSQDSDEQISYEQSVEQLMTLMASTQQ